MYEAINQIVLDLNSALTGSILLFALGGSGLWFTFHLRFVQIRGFFASIKLAFKGLFSKNRDRMLEDQVSSFQALSTAMAAQIGTGNIVGVASAIAVGGPGAVFWMWVSAFLGMATIYAEAMMAQKFKSRSEDGLVTGGPVYYIRAAFKGSFGKVLAAVFSLLIILGLGFMGNAVQANSIAGSWSNAFGISPIVTGVILAGVSFYVFWGGKNRIAKVCEVVVPIMILFYVIGAMVVIVTNSEMIPSAFQDIITGAFNPEAVAGGAMGATIKIALTKGIARGLFSNEAGMGSTPHAHAIAEAEHPAQQGLVAMASVFLDTFVILTLTALVIITTGSRATGLTGAQLSQYAFSSVLGRMGEEFIAVCMLFFAFTTIIGWYYFGEANVRYLFGVRAVKVYAALVAICVVMGAVQEAELVWNMSDCFNSLMVLPNIIGLFALTGVIKETDREYYKNLKKRREAKS